MSKENSYSPSGVVNSTFKIRTINGSGVSGAENAADLKYYCGSGTPAANATIVATSGGDYTSIQAAVTAIEDNGVIIVYPGVYTEAVVIPADKTVTIEGVGVMGSITIQQDTGTVMTVPTGSNLLLKNVKLKSITSGTSPATLVNMAGGVGLFNKVFFDYAISNGYNATGAILVSAGANVFSECKYKYISTGTSAGHNNFLTATGVAIIQMVRGYVKMTIAATDTSTHMHFYKDESNSSDVIHFVDFRLYASAGFRGDIDFIHSEANGEIEVQNCKILIVATSAGAGSHAQAYHLSGTLGCHIHSTGNRIEVTGFEENFIGSINTSETLYSHFDDIVAEDGIDGTGTYSYVNSPSNGDLQMSGDIIKKVVTITADHPSTADWEFGILDATPSTVDITATVNTSIFGTLPSGAKKMFINSGTAHNLIIDPNGAVIDGSTNDRVIYPSGYIIVEKIGSQSVIISSRNTSFNIELADIANKSFHVDFSNTSSITVDGSNHITNVVDSVNSWNGTPSSATGVAYGGTTQNGLNTARWDTSNTPLSFGNNNIHSNLAGRGMTIIAIVKPNSPNDAIMTKYYDGTPNREWRFYTSSSYIYSNLDASGPEAIINYSSNYGEWQVIQLEWVPAQGSKMYKNGFLLASSSSPVATIPAGTANLLLGASDITQADFMGEIGEIIAFSDTLSDDEREALTSKLGAKWEIDTAVFSSSDSSPFGRNSDNNTISPLILGDNIETTGKITSTNGAMTGLSVYADNTAAASLSVGDFYRTATGVLMVRF